MLIKSYKTKAITQTDDLYDTLDAALPPLQEKSILVISAKVVAICEGNVVENNGSVTKESLALQESEYFIKDEKFSLERKTILTVKNHILIPSAGVDVSNGNGYFILWPKDVMQSAKDIWEYVRKKNKLSHFGVILSDSCFVPLRRGAVGIGLAWCGFEPIANYIGTPDVFGKTLEYTTASHIDGLAAAAEVVIGEGSEQTPLAVIEDIPFVHFVTRPPSQQEIALMENELENDYFAPLLTAAAWQKGGAKK